MLLKRIRCGRYELTLEQQKDLEILQAELWRRDLRDAGITRPWKR